jgi:hypothetical protein
MLKIQEFISCFGTVEEANLHLGHKLSLTITEGYLHNFSEKSKIFIYNKGKFSDIDNPMVREANGLILDDSYTLVSKGPDHHYEVNVMKDLPLGFKLYRSDIEEMTTGMMITVFNYKGVWSVATKDSINDPDYTIDVKRCAGKGLDSWWTAVFEKDKNYIYIFDFISKEYDSIWPCPTFKLYLLSIIDKETGEEFDPFEVDDMARELGFARPKHKRIAGKRSMQSFMETVRIPSRGVVISNNGIKVKLRNPLYYSIKTADEAEDRVEPIHVAKIFLACRDSVDLLVVSNSFPKYAEFLELFDRTMKTTLRDLTTMWLAVQQFVNDSATFAKAVPAYPFSHLLFMYKNGRIKTIKEGLDKISAHQLLNITKDKYEKEFENNNGHLKIEHAYENRIISD